jgi:hypothetical protein
MKKRIKNLMLATAMGVSSPACFPTCFVSGVRVDTPDGPRPIDELKPGDPVWSWDTETAALVTRAVVKTLRAHAQTLCRLEIDGATIAGVTPSHPFYRADIGSFAALRDLPRDAPLARLQDGALKTVSVSDLHITEHPEPRTPVFNLEVGGPEHNYFAEGVLVHNKEPIEPIFFHGGPEVTQRGSNCDGWTYQEETTCGATDAQRSSDAETGPSQDGVDEVSSTPDGQD